MSKVLFSFNFFSRLITYRSYIETGSYSPSNLSSVFFFLPRLRLILYARVRECLSSVVLLPVSSFLNAISLELWLWSGRHTGPEVACFWQGDQKYYHRKYVAFA